MIGASDDEALRKWVEAYGRAWVERDPEAAGALFSETAEYHESPFEEPFRGREGIERYWREATSTQRDVEFSFEILSSGSQSGIAHWSAGFTRIASGARLKLDGILVLTFGQDGLCTELREWWHIEEVSGAGG